VYQRALGKKKVVEDDLSARTEGSPQSISEVEVRRYRRMRFERELVAQGPSRPVHATTLLLVLQDCVFDSVHVNVALPASRGDAPAPAAPEPVAQAAQTPAAAAATGDALPF
jgi:hypothetical protein